MSNYVNTTIETREAEVNYIVEIHKDMRDNCKYWYTNSYDFSNGDRVKITVEITKNWSTAVTVAESEVKDMKIKLLDIKEYAEYKGREFYFQSSFNMNNKIDHVWSNGWCPVSYFKKLIDGSVIGKISNELVPTEIYNGMVVEFNDKTFLYHCNKA